MNAVHPRSVGSSAEMSDLDGFSIPGDYNYNMHPQYTAGNEDFGFDPPSSQGFPKAEPFSPPTMTDPLQMSGWSGFEGTESKDLSMNHLHSPTSDFELNRMLSHSISNSAAISRFGQVTPPRSNSASSEISNKNIDVCSPKSTPTERRKRSTKAAVKDELDASQPTPASRKRKNSRKTSSVKEEQDDKRRQSLEKNRLAAAKCRINKKEKTEQLQRNSHDKAVHNAFLKEQVMRMKEEVQQMNALLLAHANCEGCKSPEEIQKHLSNLGNEFFTHHMPMSYDYPSGSIDDMSSMQTEYFSGHPSNPGMLNPPLPDFDRTGEFEVHTPMQTD